MDNVELVVQKLNILLSKKVLAEAHEQTIRDAIDILKKQEREIIKLSDESSKHQEIVRCKDCKYGFQDENLSFTRMVRCNKFNCWKTEKYFCGAGKRKVGEVND